jgi:hypothetical protein
MMPKRNVRLGNVSAHAAPGSARGSVSIAYDVV